MSPFTYWMHTRGVRLMYWVVDRMYKLHNWYTDWHYNIEDVIWRIISFSRRCPSCRIEYGYGHGNECEIADYWEGVK